MGEPNSACEVFDDEFLPGDIPSAEATEDPATESLRSTAKDVSGFNRIICGSSEDMREIADQTVHLIVTSPPYCVGKEYETEQSFEDWVVLMKKVCAEMRRVLVPGGRVCINVAGIGRSPYRPTQYYVTEIMLDLGFLMRGEIIWNKGASAGGSSAWGSWMSATNPVLRDIHEYVLVFGKETMKRVKSGDNTIGREEFLEYTKSVWSFPTESAKRIGHPSPFPLELPKRLIELYSFEGDVVLDPFCGSGTTCVVALALNRRYVGYDIVSAYCELTCDRIRQAQELLQGERLRKDSDRQARASTERASALKGDRQAIT